ncbi:tRNA (N(6)-L-threonylcarbamoyladenosine(37)-C(2))-methylthiotransferase MtaB [Scatolibacter rhodanostii]|uniref:tRNA (N(6)-L-threonylcarbamoyladenosine(37)-C(2))- methylthiotransferase MtaB n=1 Tax=Scatolibacter rhodanostii TaxID=2014781 RepID=UPI000C07A1ED|nr:tRNA (N(6)-L-threonylcarbamoyladenosine(37)-C(2))-methylthiotransferase MtaB [Scatolibacter rhodanostii]
MKVKIRTLGCKVNQYESEVMMSLLLSSGFFKAESEEPADVIIVNSCTVTAASDKKVRQTLRHEKKQNPDAVAVLTGCMPQAFPEIADRFLDADIVIGTKNRSALPSHILQYLSTKQRIIDIAPHEKGDKFESMQITSFGERTRAFLKIQDGCNRFCSYCIIPYARGRVRSKPLDDIQKEVHALAENGYREIVLTGINLPAYGEDLDLHLCDAVDAVCAEESIKRVRLGSLEPERLTPHVIARLAKQEKLCPSFHLSLQSGCDETLKRMNRHYTTNEYRKIVADLREAFPNCAITTDIMVGFPGETDEEFEASLAFAKEIEFARTHVFAYSRRPGTKAYDAPNQLTNSVKNERSHRMIAVITQTQRDFHELQVGRTEEVIFEQLCGENLYEGYTMNYTPVHAYSEIDITKQILPVKITRAENDYCVGNLT